MPACVQNTVLPTTSPASQTQLTSPKHKPVELTLVSFAVTRAAYSEIIPLFQEKWRREQNQGDVLINYENEFILAAQEGLAKDALVIIPEVNISIDNAIAVVDKYVDRRETREVAEAFVQFLYTSEAQRAFAKVGFRPLDPAVAQEFSRKFPSVKKLFTVEAFGGWNAIHERFFKDGGVFDRIQANLRAQH